MSVPRYAVKNMLPGPAGARPCGEPSFRVKRFLPGTRSVREHFPTDAASRIGGERKNDHKANPCNAEGTDFLFNETLYQTAAQQSAGSGSSGQNDMPDAAALIAKALSAKVFVLPDEDLFSCRSHQKNAVFRTKTVDTEPCHGYNWSNCKSELIMTNEMSSHRCPDVDAELRKGVF